MQRNFPHFKVKITVQYNSVVHTLFSYFITFSCFRKPFMHKYICICAETMDAVCGIPTRGKPQRPTKR